MYLRLNLLLANISTTAHFMVWRNQSRQLNKTTKLLPQQNFLDDLYRANDWIKKVDSLFDHDQTIDETKYKINTDIVLTFGNKSALRFKRKGGAYTNIANCLSKSNVTVDLQLEPIKRNKI